MARLPRLRDANASYKTRNAPERLPANVGGQNRKGAAKTRIDLGGLDRVPAANPDLRR